MSSTSKTLAQYILDVRRLLHDATGKYWSDAELTDYINEARERVVADTGCNRTKQISYMTQGIETLAFGGVNGILLNAGGSGYSPDGTYALGFAGGGNGSGAAGTYTVVGGIVTAVTLTAQGTGYTAVPTISFPTGGGTNASATAGIILVNTFDVLNIRIQWGSMWYQLDYKPFSQLSTLLRAWQTWQQRPVAFSVYGPNTIYVGPTPDQTYPIELDTVISPVALVNTTDADTISFPYVGTVKFYAAYLAKFKEQSYDEATKFEQEYRIRLRESIRSSFTRRIPSMYR